MIWRFWDFPYFTFPVQPNPDHIGSTPVYTFEFEGEYFCVWLGSREVVQTRSTVSICEAKLSMALRLYDADKRK